MSRYQNTSAHRWTRRSFLSSSMGAGIAFLGNALPDLSSAAHGQTVRRTAPNSMAEWMDAWTGERAKDVNGGLYIFRFADRMWVVTRPITWSPNPGQSQYKPVTVPAGFVTDFASIPRPFYTLLPPDGNYSYAAVFHDYLYWMQDRPRAEADDILRLAMQEFNLGTLTVQSIYGGVRAAGSFAWSSNSRLKKRCEKRLLAKLPDDPKVTWQTYKTRSDVYASDQSEPASCVKKAN